MNDEKNSYRSIADPQIYNMSNSAPSRRRVLQTVGSSALLGMGIIHASKSVAANSGGEDEESITTEPLSARETGQLRGTVFSSSAFKTVRQALREEGFTVQMEEIAAKLVMNEETGTERRGLKLQCEYDGDAIDDRTRGAVLFAHETDEEISARSISQTEGEPIVVHECAVVTDDESGDQWNNELVRKEYVSIGGVE